MPSEAYAKYMLNPNARTFHLDYTSVPNIEQKVQPYTLTGDFFHLYMPGESSLDSGEMFEHHKAELQTAPFRIAEVLGRAAELDLIHQQIVITNNPMCANLGNTHPRAAVYSLLGFMKQQDLYGRPWQYSPVNGVMPSAPAALIQRPQMEYNPAVYNSLEQETHGGQQWPQPSRLPPVYATSDTGVVVSGDTQFLYYTTHGFMDFMVIPCVRVNSSPVPTGR